MRYAPSFSSAGGGIDPPPAPISNPYLKHKVHHKNDRFFSLLDETLLEQERIHSLGHEVGHLLGVHPLPQSLGYRR